MLPRPPASLTAATSFGAVAGQIAACIIGTFISNRSHTGVRNMALLPTRSGTEKAPLSTQHMMPSTETRCICTRPINPTSWKVISKCRSSPLGAQYGATHSKAEKRKRQASSMPSAACLHMEGIQREQRSRASRGCPSRESRKRCRSRRGAACSNRNAGFLARIRMRQAVGDGTILVLEWHDSPKERIGKEHTHVHGSEQEDLLALARGSLRSRQAGVGGRVAGSRLRQPCSRRPRAQPRARGHHGGRARLPLCFPRH